jgi:hypothetical protein
VALQIKMWVQVSSSVIAT